MQTPSLERLAGPCATVVGVGGLLYGALFAWIVVGAPDWVPKVWFALLTVGGLLVLARRSGQRPTGTGYPWLQIAYLVLVAALVVDLLIAKPAYTWGSVAVVASGVRFYALWGRSARATAA